MKETIPTAARTLILASSSPRRQELIRRLGLPVRVVPSLADESVETNEPRGIVEQLSLRKAEAVAVRLPEGERTGIIVGSDTIVALDGQVLGKPRDGRHAAEMLQSLQGRSHEVYSGVALIDLEDGRRMVSSSRTVVRMKPLSAERIERYIRTGEPADKAGGYAIQGLGAALVDRIEGDYYTVVGLPLSLLSDMLRELGAEVL